ncbi:MAG: hypothetical protein MUC99_13340 [Anaerolineae bacterium]|nr:hypothetical protein [Anaerolineae bacterium]
MDKTHSHKSARKRTPQHDETAAPLMTPDAVVQMQRVVGNRAMTQMLQRKVSTQTLNVTADATDGVTYMEAIIGAASTWGRGSKAQPGQPSRIKSVGALKGRYVGGHMLNQEVGGDGTWDNMIVQSHTSNTNMNLHDNIIKRLGYVADSLEDMGNTTQKQYEYYIKEEIDVNAANPDGSSNFAAENFIPASLDVTLTPRKRHKTTKVASDWTTHNETINNPYHVVNVPPYPRAPNAPYRRRQTPAQKWAADRRKLKKLAGTYAYYLTKAQLRLARGIGPTVAMNLRKFFKANQMPLKTLAKQDLTGLGFNLNHIHALRSAGIK